MSEKGDCDSNRDFGSRDLRSLYSPERDPFLCTCGPCKKFWRDTFSESGDLLREPSACRAQHTAILSAQSRVVKVGDRIMVQNKFPGTVKWVGILDEDSIAPELYVGVRLDDNVNSAHNGIYNGKRYFHVPRGHGAMVKYTEVVPLKQAERRPPVSGNVMFPSFQEVQRRRRDRNQKLSSIYASAGMSGPQFEEPYASPSRQGSRGPPTKAPREPTIHISDPHDIALRDLQKKSQIDTKRQVMKEDREQKEMERFKQHFVGDQDADRLAMTLRKLKLAYQEGKELVRRRNTRDYEASDSGVSDY